MVIAAVEQHFPSIGADLMVEGQSRAAAPRAIARPQSTGPPLSIRNSPIAAVKAAISNRAATMSDTAAPRLDDHR
jgi:hypothetical protein